MESAIATDGPKRYKMKARPVRDPFELCAVAAEMLKRAGFTLRMASMDSEACYYGFGDHPALIRIAAHRFGRRNKIGVIGHVVAKITFTGTGLDGPDKMRISEEKVVTMVQQAIGTYFLARNEPPPPSSYRGKLGTWKKHSA